MEASGDCTAGYRIKVFNYRSGIVEAMSSFVPVPRKRGAAVIVQRTEQEKRDRAADNARRAGARALASVRRLCLASGVDRLLTLTYRENREDLGAAWGDFERFVRKIRTHYPRWMYVCVAERQQRGAVHFHLGVRGWQNVVLLRNTWVEVVGRGGGNIDVTSPRKATSPAVASMNCARYITKYLAKGFARAGGSHRYRASQITLPFEVYRIPATTWREAADATLAAVASSGRAVMGLCFDANYALTWAVGWIPPIVKPFR